MRKKTAKAQQAERRRVRAIRLSLKRAKEEGRPHGLARRSVAQRRSVSRAGVEAREAQVQAHALRYKALIMQALKANQGVLRATVRALNAQGVPSARGGRWYAGTLAQVLKRLKIDPETFMPPER